MVQIVQFRLIGIKQAASSRLGFGAQQTMSIAQRLYEGVEGSDGGLITYMRTDGVSMAASAVDAVRTVAVEQFGESAVPKEPRVYKSKQKNAQEAHEAIRPTDPVRKFFGAFLGLRPPLLDESQLRRVPAVF